MTSTLSFSALALLALTVLPAGAQERDDHLPLGRPSWSNTSVEAPPAPDVKPSWAKPVVKPAVKKAETPAEPEPTGIREVRASRYPIEITTKLRFNTMLELPKQDRILDVLNGDEGMWSTNLIGDNMIHVKPKEAGVYTNLMLVAASGTVYNFLLREGRADGKPLALPDIKVTVLGDESGPAPVRKLYTVAEFDAVQAQLIEARAQLDAAQQQADERVAEAKRQPSVIHFPYAPISYAKPFLIKSAYQTETATYFRTDARELPALYEVKDGEPSVVDYKVPEPGLLVVPKLMESGYFILGKQRLGFAEKKGTGN